MTDYESKEYNIDEHGTSGTNEKKLRVSRISLGAAVFLTLIKLAAAYFSGSLAVLSEVFHSAIDILACTMTILSIRLASKPPDKEHNYGHDKVESFSALFQVLILVVTSSYIFYEGINRLFFGKSVAVEVEIWTFAVILIAIGVDISRVRALKRVAKETGSQALEAEALHFSSDIFTSSIVLLALGLTYFNVSGEADSIAAIVVSIIIIITGFKLSRKAINSLMDRVPEGLSEKIQYETKLIEGVEDIESFRIRSTGSQIFIDMTILVSRIIPFSKAHDICDTVERKISELADNADVIIHSEPVETKRETINDKIKMIVHDFGLRCHDIFSHKIESEIFTELHVEVKDTNDLREAHKIITEIEDAIKSKLDMISHVKIHIDEPSEILFETVDITDKSGEIVREVKMVLTEHKKIDKCYDIMVVSTNGKIRVSLSCHFDTSLSFDEVHDLVTFLESKIYLNLKEKYPRISNVMIHAEPGQLNLN